MTQTTSESGGSRLDRIEANLDRLISVTSSSREDIDLLSERVGDLAQSISDLKQGQQDLQATVAQVATTVETLARNAEADRQAFIAESRRIWEYLLSQHPNGQGGGQ